MPRKKSPYHEKVVPFTIGAKRKEIAAFDRKIEELGFTRSEVISQYMRDFVKMY